MPHFDYHVVDERFSNLLKIVEQQFTPRETKAVLEFVKVGEYGLALDTFVSIIVEEAKQIPANTCSHFEDIAIMIEFDKHLAWLEEPDIDTAVSVLRNYCQSLPSS